MEKNSFNRILSGFVKNVLLYLILILIAQIIFFIGFYRAFELPFDGIDFCYFIIAYVIIGGAYTRSKVVEVKVNERQVFQNRTGELDEKIPGDNFVSPFQNLFKIVDTQKHYEIESIGDAPAKNDLMKYKFKIFWQPNIQENVKENMEKYVKTTPENISSALKGAGEAKIITFIFAQENAFEAKSKKDESLTKDDLSDLCEEFGIRITKITVNDFDYSPEFQEALKTESAMKMFNKAVDALMKGDNPPHDVSEAIKIVKGKMIKGFKDYEITNRGGGNAPNFLFNDKND